MVLHFTIKMRLCHGTSRPEKAKLPEVSEANPTNNESKRKVAFLCKFEVSKRGVGAIWLFHCVNGSAELHFMNHKMH